MAASEGINVYSLNVTPNDTFSLPETKSSNYITVERDTTAPVVNNLAVAFPLLPNRRRCCKYSG